MTNASARKGYIDTCMRGESENAKLSWLERLACKHSSPTVPGLVMLWDGKDGAAIDHFVVDMLGERHCPLSSKGWAHPTGS
jgi:hypothetical protein